MPALPSLRSRCPRSDPPLLDPPDLSGGLSGTRYWALGPDQFSFPPAHPHPHPHQISAAPAVDPVDLFPPAAATTDHPRQTSSSSSSSSSVTLATLAIPPGMGTALDALAPPQPLNARRPGAPSLPSFELPAPNFSAAAFKYPPHHPHLPPPNSSVSTLITSPATTQHSDPISAVTTTTSTTTPATTSTTSSTPATTTTAATGATGIPVSASPDLTSYWAQSAYGSASGAAARQAWSSGLSSSYSNRDTFSPSFNPLHRNPATSTPGTEAIPSAYDMNQLPPFHQPPPPPPPQHHHHHHHLMAHAMLTAQNGLPNPAASPHPLPSNDPYMPKSSSAPAYGAVQQLSSPAGAAYQPYGAAPPALAMHHPPRVVSNPPHPAAGAAPHHLSYQRQPWPSYSLPAMNGPVMSNVHSPGNQMSLLGPLQTGLLPGFSSGHMASMQQMYGGHPPHPGHGGPGPTNDRPFKCDQCPQSFNRNHDLKRHKRIHLSVKPFPCNHCDKSFSRKDALKRHILVKGCGKEGAEGSKPVKEEDKPEDESNGHS
ncbi:hypothetical protein ARAM_006499 [Aspergillus rambellii]|uniref:C2H2-type domain-containing protein n=1 Tax=Aspergillus rambellii TaxID=308745 RepID=A0A0F8XUC5_9EURO|nr:hypothetical protein ARAM_006499 [Aspergillus rambellii]